MPLGPLIHYSASIAQDGDISQGKAGDVGNLEVLPP